MATNKILAAVIGVGNFVRAEQDASDSSVALRHVPEVGGAAISSSNPMPVSDAGAGTPADAAWSGSGNGSIVAVLKAIWSAITAALTVKGVSIAITQTVVNLTSIDTQIIAANSSRKYLAIVNIGTGLATISFGTGAAVAGQGYPLSAAAAAGDQGGGLVFDATAIPPGAIHGICAAGVTTTMVVLEGV